jgi:hypothetical protein
MFQALFKRVETSVDGIVDRFLDRVTVAVPLIVAAGFGTTALTIKLIELYGAVTACILMAFVFVALGLVAAAITATPSIEQTESTARTAAETAETETGTDTDLEDLFTPEIRAFLATAAPVALPGVTRSMLKNLPLLIVLAVAAYLFSIFSTPEANSEPVADPTKSPLFNGNDSVH